MVMTHDYDRRGPPDDDKWRPLIWASQMKSHRIETELKTKYGGVFDGYVLADDERSEKANRLREVLEQHYVAERAYTEKRYPTDADMKMALKRLKTR